MVPSSRDDQSSQDAVVPLEKKAVISNPHALSDPDYSDEDAPAVEQIAADEGKLGIQSTKGTIETARFT